MTLKSNMLLIAVAMTGLLTACSNDANNDDYATLDRDWDATDSAFMADYTTVKTENDRLSQEIQAMNASGDTAASSQYATAQQKLAAHRQALQDLENRRAAARAARDAARTAKNRAAYDSARMGYTTWKADLDRIRTEQTELQGTIKVGSKTVGSVDANLKDTSKPLLRVEPGKNDDKPLIRVEPGKDDNKPLIEKNKNP